MASYESVRSFLKGYDSGRRGNTSLRESQKIWTNKERDDPWKGKDTWESQDYWSWCQNYFEDGIHTVHSSIFIGYHIHSGHNYCFRLEHHVYPALQHNWHQVRMLLLQLRLAETIVSLFPRCQGVSLILKYSSKSVLEQEHVIIDMNPSESHIYL